MNDSTHLFMFGGSPPFTEKLGQLFARLVLQCGSGKVAVLFLERDGWQSYMSNYTEPLEKSGVTEFNYIALRKEQSNETVEGIKDCSGIIIGGGDTGKYRDLIVETQVGEAVTHHFAEGMPVAGFSAGALISPDKCVISPLDNTSGRQLFRQGLGLIKDVVISAHYSKWNEEKQLKHAVLKTEVTAGYGLDDNAGMYMENNRVMIMEGSHIYECRRKTAVGPPEVEKKT